MRYAVALAVFTLIALVAWPYVYLYRLDRAVSRHDMAALAALVDIESVRQAMKREGKRETETGAKTFLGWIREGIRQIGGRAVDISVDLDWVYETLHDRDGDPATEDPPILSATTYAFFEAYDRFLVRIGELGRQPIHLRFTLENGRWRVTGIYD